jgi:tRNA nucleotidyltransferase (CCA-adding enzyme)
MTFEQVRALDEYTKRVIAHAIASTLLHRRFVLTELGEKHEIIIKNAIKAIEVDEGIELTYLTNDQVSKYIIELQAIVFGSISGKIKPKSDKFMKDLSEIVPPLQ